ALWGAIVFPVIASCFWDRVTNAAFTLAVVAALLAFSVVRFELLPMTGALALVMERLAAIGAGVVAWLMTFGFFVKRLVVLAFFIAAAVIGWLVAGPMIRVSV